MQVNKMREIEFVACPVPKCDARRPVYIKEVKLPYAQETHELMYEPVSSCVYVSQMSDSVLVRIKVDKTTGFLEDSEQAWRVGEAWDGRGISGLHNISLSYTHEGAIWVSLQYANTLLLLDVADGVSVPKILKRIHVPTHFGDDWSKIVGGPHVVRESPDKTGDIWVGLKGMVSCCPNVPEDDAKDEDEEPKAKRPKVCCDKKLQVSKFLPRSFAKALGRNCCSIAYARKHLHEHARRGYDAPTPNTYAVWHLPNIDAYDECAAEKGGKLYECLKSPPMVAIDALKNCWVVQDASPYVLHIDATSRQATQIKIPFPAELGKDDRFTGPGCVRADDNQIWCTALGADATLLRFNPDKNNALTYYNVGTPDWASALRTIHADFATLNGTNIMLVIASSLLDETAPDALMVLRFDSNWASVTGRRVIPLPTQDSAIHRVHVVCKDDPFRCSAVVTELDSSKLFQIKLANILDFETLTEVVDVVARSTKGDDEVPVFSDFQYTAVSYIQGAEAKGQGV